MSTHKPGPAKSEYTAQGVRGHAPLKKKSYHSTLMWKISSSAHWKIKGFNLIFSKRPSEGQLQNHPTWRTERVKELAF